MRVLLVNTRLYPGGGDSTYAFNLANLLRSKGHGVAFFAMHDQRNVPDPNADLFVSHIDFRELNQRKNLFTAIQVLKRVIYSMEAKNKFRQMLDRFMPDVVHLGNIHAHITPSVIFEAKKHGLPVIWTLHDYKLICPNAHFRIDATGQICEACGKADYYQPVLKRCKKGSRLASCIVSLEAYAHKWMGVRRQVDTFVAASIFLRNKLIEREFPPKKICHLPHFVPKEMFHYNQVNDGYLLFFGRLELIKGIRSLLGACRLIPEVRLMLAGQVEERLGSEIPILLPPNAQYIGMVSDVELPQLLRNALAVVLPSMVYENQPFSILEAFAAGKPVVASDLGGLSELVAHRERGLLVPPGDTEALAKAMRWMITHSSEAKEMGVNAHQYALSHHTPELHYQKLMDIYEKSIRKTKIIRAR
jgi:glycosyltransferase involved in cell wall biosynthesis